MALSIIHPTVLHLPALRRFNTVVYDSNAPLFDDDFFRWQFHSDLEQFGEIRSSLIAVDGDQVVATCICAPTQFEFFGEGLSGKWIHHWFSNSGHGPVGLVLLKRLLRDTQVLAGARIVPYAAAAMRALSKQWVWFEIPRVFCPFDVEQVRALVTSSDDDLMGYLSSFRRPRSGTATSSTSIDRFSSEQEGIWRGLSSEISLATPRSASFLNWRYVNHPRFEYRRHQFENAAGRFVAVWRNEKVADRDISVARLCEVFGDLDAIAEGGGTLLGEIQDTKPAFVDFSCSNGALMDALSAAGFAFSVTRPGLDLPHRFQPLENYLSKQLDFYMLAPRHLDRRWQHDRMYVTRGDSNQDVPRAS